MGFDPCNHSLKVWDSIGTPTPKAEAHLGAWRFIPSHSPTLLGAWNVTPGLPSWPTPLQALALVVSPRLRLWQKPNGNLSRLKKVYHLTFHTHHQLQFETSHFHPNIHLLSPKWKKSTIWTIIPSLWNCQKPFTKWTMPPRHHGSVSLCAECARARNHVA